MPTLLAHGFLCDRTQILTDVIKVNCLTRQDWCRQAGYLKSLVLPANPTISVLWSIDLKQIPFTSVVWCVPFCASGFAGLLSENCIRPMVQQLLLLGFHLHTFGCLVTAMDVGKWLTSMLDHRSTAVLKHVANLGWWHLDDILDREKQACSSLYKSTISLVNVNIYIPASTNCVKLSENIMLNLSC